MSNLFTNIYMIEFLVNNFLVCCENGNIDSEISLKFIYWRMESGKASIGGKTNQFEIILHNENFVLLFIYVSCHLYVINGEIA